MKKISNALFLTGFALLATHELDAVTQSEWRLLYLLRGLPEPLAESVFVALHVPLFAGLLWLTFNENERVKSVSRTVFSAFLVVHAVLHKLLELHPDYSFFSPLSQTLIYSGGLTGGAYILAKRFAK